MVVSFWIGVSLLSVVAVFNIYSVWKLLGIFKAFDDVILKTLTDTTMIERHRMFVEVLTKFGENDRKRKDKEFADMRAISKNMATELRTMRNLIDSLRKDR